MTLQRDTTKNSTAIGIWKGQPFHFASLAVLLMLVYLLWRFLGEPFPAQFWIAVGVPVTHQVYVWLAWRLELLYTVTSSSIGFRGYLVITMPLKSPIWIICTLAQPGDNQ